MTIFQKMPKNYLKFAKFKNFFCISCNNLKALINDMLLGFQIFSYLWSIQGNVLDFYRKISIDHHCKYQKLLRFRPSEPREQTISRFLFLNPHTLNYHHVLTFPQLFVYNANYTYTDGRMKSCSDLFYYLLLLYGR